MATRDVSDRQICEAVQEVKVGASDHSTLELLSKRTGQCEKVCFRAMERAYGRGLLDYGVSLGTAWLTPAGEKLLGEGG